MKSSFCMVLLLSGLLALIPFTAMAGGSEGLVTTPLVHEGDILMFSAGTHSNRPSCASATLGTWAVKLNTEKGRAMMSLVLTAHAQGKRLHVQGFPQADCADWGDRERPMYAFIVD